MVQLDTRFPYEDKTLDIGKRVEDLLSRMSLDDKVALMFQPLASLGEFTEPGLFGSPSTQTLFDRGISHFNVLQASSARELAEWCNAVQRVGAATPLRIPVTISSDPRHAFSNNPGAGLMSGPFSQWPEMLGFGALDDPELIEKFADTVRREYLAVGLRAALHPQVDIASDARWSRANGTFGSDADVVARLGVGYVRGLQGTELGATSVATMAKHFPGGGPQLDGEDPHFSYGREQVYPGGRFSLHLEPFRQLIAAGVTSMMPYYGMPVGTEYEEVGFGFNRGILTDLLRDELGFDGVICSDWGILTRTFWGVEELTYEQRMVKSIDAGVDQFGGESSPSDLASLVRDGSIAESRIDSSVRRLLRTKFALGLFDDRFVDPELADERVGAAEARAAGVEAQAASLTLLQNADQSPAHLPLRPGIRVYAEGIDRDRLNEWAEVVDDPAAADVAILRAVAPWERRGAPGDMEIFFHAGSLEFSERELDRIRRISDVVPTVLDLYLDRPAIVKPLLDDVDSLIVNFGASDEALLSVLFGNREPKGSLPFEIPSSMAEVVASLPDVPSDTAHPSFPIHSGLRFSAWQPTERPNRPPLAMSTDAPGRWKLDRALLGDLLDDPAAYAIVERYLPELVHNEAIVMIRSMPFDGVLDIAAPNVEPSVVAALRAELIAL